jgi:hypothetical protein
MCCARARCSCPPRAPPRSCAPLPPLTRTTAAVRAVCCVLCAVCCAPLAADGQAARRARHALPQRLPLRAARFLLAHTARAGEALRERGRTASPPTHTTSALHMRRAHMPATSAATAATAAAGPLREGMSKAVHRRRLCVERCACRRRA